jgi:hypothetical protein
MHLTITYKADPPISKRRYTGAPELGHITNHIAENSTSHLPSLISTTEQYAKKEFREIARSAAACGLPHLTPRWRYDVV